MVDSWYDPPDDIDPEDYQDYQDAKDENAIQRWEEWVQDNGRLPEPGELR